MEKLKHIVAVLLLGAWSISLAQVGPEYPAWREGYLDIHHISTGRGECAFAILPDGTTMMIDAGETGNDKRNFKPNGSRSAGEWIARYVMHVGRAAANQKIDYMLVTHFHDDHMGSVEYSEAKSQNGDYILSGVTDVGDRIALGKIIDRGWPDYDYPYPKSTEPDVANYIRFVHSQQNRGVPVEQFAVGSKEQFKLLRHAERYPNFEIRNIAANGVVWTGLHNNTRSYFPPIESLTAQEFPEENVLSTALRITYGKFDYFNGADIMHSYSPGTWKDIETPVGMVTGPVEVCVANHHAKDAMGAGFIKAVRPQVFVIQGFALSHPDATALRNMLSQDIYAGDRDIFTSHLFQVNRLALGEALVGQIKSTQGHTVIRVAPGGEKYEVYVLDDMSEGLRVKAVYGPYYCQ